jgi:hypothetical protein
VRLGIIDKDFEQGLKKAERDLNRFGNRLSNLGQRLTTSLSIPLALVSGAAIKLGMDAVESESLFSVSMGKMADSAREWSEELRKNLGLNAYELRKNIGVLYTMFNSMKMGERASYDMAKGLTQLAYDMASFYNLNPEEAFQKLQAGITGQVEPLKRLGIVVNETAIKQWALTNGMIKQGETMTEQQKIFARYNVIMEATSKAHGDLARTMDSPTNKLRALKEEIQNTATDLGVALLPAVSRLLQSLKPMVELVSKLVEKFLKLPEPIRNIIAGFAGLLIMLGPIIMLVGKFLTTLASIPGVITAIGSGIPLLTGSLGILVKAFAPFLIGGAIIAGLVAIVGWLSKIREEARLAATDIKSVTSMEEAQKLVDYWNKEVKRRKQERENFYEFTKSIAGDFWLRNIKKTTWGAEHERLTKEIAEAELKLKQARDKLKGLTPASPAGTDANVTVNGATVNGGLGGGKFDLNKTLADYKKEREDIIAISKALGDTENLNADLAANLRSEIALLISQGYKPEQKVLADLITEYNKYNEAAEKDKEQKFDIEKTNKRLNENMAELNAKEKLFGESTEINAQKMRLLESAMVEMVANGIDPQSEAVQALMKDYDELNQKLIDAELAMEELPAEETAEKIRTWRDALQEVSDDMGTYNDKMVNLAEYTAYSIQNAFADISFAAVKGKFDDIGDAFQNLLDSILRSLTNLFAQSLFQKFLGMFLGMGMGYDLPAGFSPSSLIPDTVPIARAIGGPVSMGSPYIVGERGPELFVPSSSGNIVPNGKIGANVQVNVINQSGVQMTAKQHTKVDAEGYIVNVMLNAVATNKGGMRDVLQGA